ncbi:MAG TPA: hypothetical protein VMQ52_00295 [Candidatus Saccharimonadales bacterium]|jgi:hypothetical protein|nr:hypothetical protein [Candidatus Saccharimonadales bacterium]
MNSLRTILGWGSPIGTGLFVALMAVTIYILSKTIDTLSKIDQNIKPKK